MKKKCIFITIFVIFTMFLAGCSSSTLPKVGISQYGEHASLDNCREGFIQGLKNEGYIDGETISLDYQNASFDNGISTQIATTYASQNVDLMVGIATPSATALYAAAEDKNIPVVFTAITDPVNAKLDQGNITGTSDQLPIHGQLSLIRALQPQATTIGIIYTTSEPNSISALEEYQRLAPEYGFIIDAIGVTQQSEVTMAADTLIARQVHAFSNLTDNNVVGVLPALLEKATHASIPIYGSEIEQVKLGCVAAAGIDYYQLGVQTGTLAARILSGEAKASDLPYETIEDYTIYMNTDALSTFNLTAPDTVDGKQIQTIHN